MDTMNVLCEQAVEYSIKAKRLKPNGSQVSHSINAVDYVRNLYKDDILVHESCYILLLDRGNRIKGHALISTGGISSTVIDRKIVCYLAINALASGVILVHNHPSGNVEPGTADRTMTKQLRDALEMLDVHLLDHIIISEDCYYSFADEDVTKLEER